MLRDNFYIKQLITNLLAKKEAKRMQKKSSESIIVLLNTQKEFLQRERLLFRTGKEGMKFEASPSLIFFPILHGDL